MNLRSRNKVTAAFSVASLTDVIFLLLIYFLLTSTLVAPNAIKLLLPRATGQTLAKQNVTVSISADLRYHIGQKEVAPGEMEAELSAALHNIAEPAVVLRADKSVPVEHVARILGIGSRLRAKMILATEPE